MSRFKNGKEKELPGNRQSEENSNGIAFLNMKK